MAPRTTQTQADLSRRIAIVTGASSGIGKEIARGLVDAGAHVVLAVRDTERGAAVAHELGGRTTVMRLDVASLDSIRDFADDFLRRFDALHILVNNAGAWFSDRRVSDDGHELTFATNVLGPYLLTQLLEPILIASGDARIVNVVSAFASDYDASDLQWSRRKFDGVKVYAQSKLALRMLTWGLAARLEGTGVTANAAAPGFVKTNFNQNAKGFMAAMIGLSAKLFAVSPAKGAETPLWAATAPELAGVTGRYLDARKEKPSKFRDPEAIRELESRCAALVEPRLAAAG